MRFFSRDFLSDIWRVSASSLINMGQASQGLRLNNSLFSAAELRVLTALDRDHDGNISPNEFITYLRGKSADDLKRIMSLLLKNYSPAYLSAFLQIARNMSPAESLRIGQLQGYINRNFLVLGQGKYVIDIGSVPPVIYSPGRRMNFAQEYREIFGLINNLPAGENKTTMLAAFRANFIQTRPARDSGGNNILVVAGLEINVGANNLQDIEKKLWDFFVEKGKLEFVFDQRTGTISLDNIGPWNTELVKFNFELQNGVDPLARLEYLKAVQAFNRLAGKSDPEIDRQVVEYQHINDDLPNLIPGYRFDRATGKIFKLTTRNVNGQMRTMEMEVALDQEARIIRRQIEAARLPEEVKRFFINYLRERVKDAIQIDQRSGTLRVGNLSFKPGERFAGIANNTDPVVWEDILTSLIMGDSGIVNIDETSGKIFLRAGSNQVILDYSANNRERPVTREDFYLAAAEITSMYGGAELAGVYRGKAQEINQRISAISTEGSTVIIGTGASAFRLQLPESCAENAQYIATHLRRIAADNCEYQIEIRNNQLYLRYGYDRSGRVSAGQVVFLGNAGLPGQAENIKNSLTRRIEDLRNNRALGAAGETQSIGFEITYRRGADEYKLDPVTGNVTKNGQPLELTAFMEMAGLTEAATRTNYDPLLSAFINSNGFKNRIKAYVFPNGRLDIYKARELADLMFHYEDSFLVKEIKNVLKKVLEENIKIQYPQNAEQQMFLRIGFNSAAGSTDEVRLTGTGNPENDEEILKGARDFLINELVFGQPGDDLSDCLEDAFDDWRDENNIPNPFTDRAGFNLRPAQDRFRCLLMYAMVYEVTGHHFNNVDNPDQDYQHVSFGSEIPDGVNGGPGEVFEMLLSTLQDLQNEESLFALPEMPPATPGDEVRRNALSELRQIAERIADDPEFSEYRGAKIAAFSAIRRLESIINRYHCSLAQARLIAEINARGATVLSTQERQLLRNIPELLNETGTGLSVNTIAELREGRYIDQIMTAGYCRNDLIPSDAHPLMRSYCQSAAEYFVEKGFLSHHSWVMPKEVRLLQNNLINDLRNDLQLAQEENMQMELETMIRATDLRKDNSIGGAVALFSQIMGGDFEDMGILITYYMTNSPGRFNQAQIAELERKYGRFINRHNLTAIWDRYQVRIGQLRTRLEGLDPASEQYKIVEGQLRDLINDMGKEIKDEVSQGVNRYYEQTLSAEEKALARELNEILRDSDNPDERARRLNEFRRNRFPPNGEISQNVMRYAAWLQYNNMLDALNEYTTFSDAFVNQLPDIGFQIGIMVAATVITVKTLGMASGATSAAMASSIARLALLAQRINRFAKLAQVIGELAVFPAAEMLVGAGVHKLRGEHQEVHNARDIRERYIHNAAMFGAFRVSMKVAAKISGRVAANIAGNTERQVTRELSARILERAKNTRLRISQNTADRIATYLTQPRVVAATLAATGINLGVEYVTMAGTDVIAATIKGQRLNSEYWQQMLTNTATMLLGMKFGMALAHPLMKNSQIQMALQREKCSNGDLHVLRQKIRNAKEPREALRHSRELIVSMNRAIHILEGGHVKKGFLQKYNKILRTELPLLEMSIRTMENARFAQIVDAKNVGNFINAGEHCKFENIGETLQIRVRSNDGIVVANEHLLYLQNNPEASFQVNKIRLIVEGEASLSQLSMMQLFPAGFNPATKGLKSGVQVEVVCNTERAAFSIIDTLCNYSPTEYITPWETKGNVSYRVVTGMRERLIRMAENSGRLLKEQLLREQQLVAGQLSEPSLGIAEKNVLRARAERIERNLADLEKGTSELLEYFKDTTRIIEDNTLTKAERTVHELEYHANLSSEVAAEVLKGRKVLYTESAGSSYIRAEPATKKIYVHDQGSPFLPEQLRVILEEAKGHGYGENPELVFTTSHGHHDHTQYVRDAALLAVNEYGATVHWLWADLPGMRKQLRGTLSFNPELMEHINTPKNNEGKIHLEWLAPGETAHNILALEPAGEGVKHFIPCGRFAEFRNDGTVIVFKGDDNPSFNIEANRQNTADELATSIQADFIGQFQSIRENAAKHNYEINEIRIFQDEGHWDAKPENAGRLETLARQALTNVFGQEHNINFEFCRDHQKTRTGYKFNAIELAERNITQRRRGVVEDINRREFKGTIEVMPRTKAGAGKNVLVSRLGRRPSSELIAEIAKDSWESRVNQAFENAYGKDFSSREGLAVLKKDGTLRVLGEKDGVVRNKNGKEIAVEAGRLKEIIKQEDTLALVHLDPAGRPSHSDFVPGINLAVVRYDGSGKLISTLATPSGTPLFTRMLNRLSVDTAGRRVMNSPLTVVDREINTEISFNNNNSFDLTKLSQDTLLKITTRENLQYIVSVSTAGEKIRIIDGAGKIENGYVGNILPWTAVLKENSFISIVPHNTVKNHAYIGEAISHISKVEILKNNFKTNAEPSNDNTIENKNGVLPENDNVREQIKQQTRDNINKSIAENKKSEEHREGNKHGQQEHPGQRNQEREYSDESNDNITINNQRVSENTGRIEHQEISSGEAKNILGQLKIEGAEYKGKLLTKRDIESTNLEPKYKLSLTGQEVYVSRISYSGSHYFALVYIKQGGRYIPRTFYLSNSQGIFRYLPSYSMNAAGDVGHFSKLGNEHALSAHPRLQETLQRIVIGERAFERNLKAENNIEVFVGTCRSDKFSEKVLRTEITKRFGTTAEKLLDSFNNEYLLFNPLSKRFGSYEKIKAKDGSNISLRKYLENANKDSLRGVKLQNPETITAESLFSSAEKNPDFNQLESSYDAESPIYGRYRVELYRSRDGELLYTFCRAKDRVWLGNIDYADVAIDRLGLAERTVQMPKKMRESILSPLMEYSGQCMGENGQYYGNAEIKVGGYVDLFKNYISKIPMVAEYIKFRTNKSTEIVKIENKIHDDFIRDKRARDTILNKENRDLENRREERKAEEKQEKQNKDQDRNGRQGQDNQKEQKHSSEETATNTNNLKKINLRELSEGTVLRLTTASGSVYEIKIVSLPENHFTKIKFVGEKKPVGEITCSVTNESLEIGRPLAFATEEGLINTSVLRNIEIINSNNKSAELLTREFAAKHGVKLMSMEKNHYMQTPVEPLKMNSQNKVNKSRRILKDLSRKIFGATEAARTKENVNNELSKIEDLKAIIDILTSDGEKLKYVAERFRDDPELIRLAAKTSKNALLNASSRLQENRNFVREMILAEPLLELPEKIAEDFRVFQNECQNDLGFLKLLNNPAVTPQAIERNYSALLRYLLYEGLDPRVDPRKGLIAKRVREVVPSSVIREFDQIRRTLREEFNIEFIYRFEIPVLEHMLQIRRQYLRGELASSDKVAVYIFPKADWNYAFEHNQASELMAKGYKILYFEVENYSEFRKVLTETSTNLKIDTLIVGGHGTQGSVKLGNSMSLRDPRFIFPTAEELDLKNLKEISNIQNSPRLIILKSCSTGKGKAAAKNIANEFKRIFSNNERTPEIYAPTEPTAIEKFVFTKDGYLQEPKYRTAESTEGINVYRISAQTDKVRLTTIEDFKNIIKMINEKFGPDTIVLHGDALRNHLWGRSRLSGNVDILIKIQKNIEKMNKKEIDRGIQRVKEITDYLENILRLENGAIATGQAEVNGLKIDFFGYYDSKSGKIFSRTGLGELNKVHLTIDSLYMDSKGKVYGPAQDLADLKNRLIRFTGNESENNIHHETVLTALRLKHQLGFEYTPETADIINRYFREPQSFAGRNSFQTWLGKAEFYQQFKLLKKSDDVLLLKDFVSEYIKKNYSKYTEEYLRNNEIDNAILQTALPKFYEYMRDNNFKELVEIFDWFIWSTGKIPQGTDVLVNIGSKLYDPVNDPYSFGINLRQILESAKDPAAAIRELKEIGAERFFKASGIDIELEYNKLQLFRNKNRMNTDEQESAGNGERRQGGQDHHRRQNNKTETDPMEELAGELATKENISRQDAEMLLANPELNNRYREMKSDLRGMDELLERIINKNKREIDPRLVRRKGLELYLKLRPYFEKNNMLDGLSPREKYQRDYSSAQRQREFEYALDSAVEQAVQRGNAENLGIVKFSLRDLGRYNKAYEHDGANQIMTNICQQVRQNIPSDIIYEIYRSGPDFMLVLDKYSMNRNNLEIVRDKIKKIVDTSLIHQEKRINERIDLDVINMEIELSAKANLAEAIEIIHAIKPSRGIDEAFRTAGSKRAVDEVMKIKISELSKDTINILRDRGTTDITAKHKSLLKDQPIDLIRKSIIDEYRESTDENQKISQIEYVDLIEYARIGSLLNKEPLIMEKNGSIEGYIPLLGADGNVFGSLRCKFNGTIKNKRQALEVLNNKIMPTDEYKQLYTLIYSLRYADPLLTIMDSTGRTPYFNDNVYRIIEQIGSGGKERWQAIIADEAQPLEMRRVAQLFLEEGCIFIRAGGDEFAVYLPDRTANNNNTMLYLDLLKLSRIPVTLGETAANHYVAENARLLRELFIENYRSNREARSAERKVVEAMNITLEAINGKDIELYYDVPRENINRQITDKRGMGIYYIEHNGRVILFSATNKGELARLIDRYNADNKTKINIFAAYPLTMKYLLEYQQISTLGNGPVRVNMNRLICVNPKATGHFDRDNNYQAPKPGLSLVKGFGIAGGTVTGHRAVEEMIREADLVSTRVHDELDEITKLDDHRQPSAINGLAD